MFRPVIAVIGGALLLCSCAAGPALVPGPHLQVVSTTELPPPTDGNNPNGDNGYRIGPSDQLKINVFDIEQLSGTFRVDAGGKIALPLAGTMQALGRTPQELASDISGRLRGYVRSPAVSVNVEESASNVFTIDGEVTQPGIYPVIGRMSLMRAIASARGASQYARLTDVVVFRTVGTQKMAALYNLEAIRRGTYEDPFIYSNDLIVVGDSPSRRLFANILAASPLVVPVVALVQQL